MPMILWCGVALYLIGFVVLYIGRDASFKKVVDETLWMSVGYVRQNYEELNDMFLFREDRDDLKKMPDAKQIPLIPKSLAQKMMDSKVILSFIVPLGTCLIMFGIWMVLDPPLASHVIGLNFCSVSISLFMATLCKEMFCESLGKGGSNLGKMLLKAAREKHIPELKREALEYQIAELNKEIESSDPKRKKFSK